jgi:4-amino-4-deoxy-L-arabinose transferase-like glycosyltransferase
MLPVLRVGLAVTVVAIVAIGGALFSEARLTTREEQVVAVAARSNETGARPLLVHVEGELWLQPLEVYPAAVLLQAGLPPWAALRLPPAIAAVATALLTAVLVTWLCGPRAGALAALLLLLVPVFLRFAWTGGGAMMMMPPVLLWLITVLTYSGRPVLWRAVAGGVALGLALYTQPAGVLAVVVYFGVGSVALRTPRRGLVIASAAAGVLLCAAPLFLVFLRDQAIYPDTFGRWAVHLAHIRNPLDGLVAFLRWDVMGRRVGEYWHYLNPSFLFLSGTMFNPLLAALIPLGVRGVVSNSPAATWLLLAAFLVAPLPAVLLDVAREPSLVLPLGVFGAALAGRGVEVALTAIVHGLNARRSQYEHA